MKLLLADNVKLGFIGLGNMGSRIARRLLAHGYTVFVYDRDIAKVDAMAGRGGVVAKNILELAGSADVILSCLTNACANRLCSRPSRNPIREARRRRSPEGQLRADARLQRRPDYTVRQIRA